jgi:serine/threonine protein kinase/tetratricopeptide (TPR) repeat protein
MTVRQDDDPIRNARDEIAALAVRPADTSVIGEGPGDVIDRYRLLQAIGEGGMGTVWMAEQREPVVRKVALKIVKLGMDTREVVTRFEAERQALALMDHPCIAKVLDGGATAHGRPFFVMELVKGVPITRFCDDTRLSLRERLELFARVCDAVQHAHHKGIIHRDLKPSNVLVTLHDGTPVPKVIDFGIAKATSAELTKNTMFTRFGQLIGTPEYMAPEQAGISALDVDTRADIYSLGVLLYELLTGTTPFEITEVLERGYQELLRTIREDEPPLPSTRVSTLGQQSGPIATRGQVDGARLARRLRGDLDWIVMKALEKDRTRRYDTASDFAADVRRHLRGDAVAVAPPSTLYRLRKFLVRRRRVVAVAALSAFLLFIGVLGTGIGWWQARVAEGQAKVEATRARTELRKAEIARDVLLKDVILAADPLNHRGPDLRVRDVLDDVGRKLDRGDLLVGEPEVEEWLRNAVATAYRGLALYAAALPHLRRSQALRRELTGGRDDAYARVLGDLATLSYEAGRLEEAMALHLEANALLRELAQPELQSGAIGERAGRLALGLFNHAALLVDHKRLEEAETMVRESMSIWSRQGGPDCEAVSHSKDLLCQILGKLGRPAEAEQAARESLAIRRRTKQPGDPMIGVSALTLAALLQDAGRNEEALPLLDECIAQMRQSWPAGHPRLAATLSRRAWLRSDDLTAALALATEALAMRRQAYAVPHKSVISSLRQCGDLLLQTGRVQEAETLLIEAVTLAPQLPLEAETELAMARAELAAIRHAAGRHAEARAELDIAVAELRRLASAKGSGYLAQAIWRSGQARRAAEGPAAALPELVEADAMAERVKLSATMANRLRAAVAACRAAVADPSGAADGRR